MSSPTLNERAKRIADFLAANAASHRVQVTQSGNGARIIDCGVKVRGGLQAGLALARICLAGQAEVQLLPSQVGNLGFPMIQVATDHPVTACMASQYAGWEVKVNDRFVGMGSGPIRALAAKEPLYAEIPGKETSPVAVGVLEAAKLPADDVFNYLAGATGLTPDKITLCVAPAASIAGTIQVVARSLETALHKLHELKFDLNSIVAGTGTAPVPPVGKNALEAIGRTNDAILYGGRVTLWVDADDAAVTETGPKIPSSASPDYGSPFAAIFERYQQDFYKIDPMLFSPAEVVIHNLRSGRCFAFGSINAEVLHSSFLSGV